MAKNRTPTDPDHADDKPVIPMRPDEMLEFEEGIVQGEDAEEPASDPDRLTKSGRLRRDQVEEATEAAIDESRKRS